MPFDIELVSIVSNVIGKLSGVQMTWVAGQTVC